MRTWTETRREGTDCGPVDWKHPSIEKALEFADFSIETLRELEKDPDSFLVTTDGGYPRVGWKRVLEFRMYDGWPYWKPMPAVLVNGLFGTEWYFIDTVTEIEKG